MGQPSSFAKKLIPSAGLGYALGMKDWVFDGVLTENGWMSPGVVSVDEHGRIAGVQSTSQREVIERVAGFAIPGLVNGHSHAFQYAMAGLAEHAAGNTEDDFWSWRESMYQLALNVDVEQVKAIAGWLYGQMLRFGYTTVVEFHYLHHNKDGSHYEPQIKMAVALCEAARDAGIHLVLVPVYYRLGGFGAPAKDHQRRFLFQDVAAYRRFIDDLIAVVPQFDAELGMGLHSLRAAGRREVIDLFSHVPERMVRHLHISEQQSEVDDCLSMWGARPVEWLVNNVDVGPWFSLVHATHIQDHEVKALCQSQANVVICPTTEANLGDGFFPMHAYQKGGGHWCIGSDSHVGLNPAEELRWLDYGQRLLQEKRNVFCRNGVTDSASWMFTQALMGGRRATGHFDRSFFSVGLPFDALILDSGHPLMATRDSSRLATWVYAFDPQMLMGTVKSGQWWVRHGEHRHQSTLQASFVDRVQSL
ncbi:MAG: formimidoylglutamate deiminase [Acidobacteria bacterium]|nr:formimidoylglutamate deiminase [Acidobacteriota bacterium]